MSHHPGENPDFSGRPGQYGPGSRGPHPGAYGAYPPPGKRPWYKRVGCVVSMIVALGLLLFGGCGAAALLAATTAVMAPDGTSQGGRRSREESLQRRRPSRSSR
ncbi:hypothetical protein [Mobilicoccus caccae]|uniref:Uncharacterized protein n=1 Tax=Mobilicoccus caccae TaxID=1859295 RepID=A0ABQ6IU03_9MICO|nr:hypothetical protein [Mobilicoccus caccae]GMA41424.1 hypothetical protein GCM10025883_34690 [Mobilicoccus caccae]